MELFERFAALLECAESREDAVLREALRLALAPLAQQYATFSAVRAGLDAAAELLER